MTDGVLFERRGAVAVVTIDRPAYRNAIDLATAQRLARIWDEIDGRSDIGAAVLASSSASVFSAGMDLKAFSRTGERPLDERRGAFGIVGRPPETPVVAAVEGKALGGGFEIVLACDLVVASPAAQFGLPEVRRGLIASGGGVMRLPRRIPRSVALELMLTGESIAGERAYELGLVNRVVAEGEVVEAAVALAATIAANAPLAVRTSKMLAEQSASWPVDELFERQAPFADAVRSSRDAAEGALAFVEKREPVWRGE